MFNILRLAPTLNASRPKPAEPVDPVFNALHTSLTASSILKVLALAALSSGLIYAASTYYLSYVTDKSLLEVMAVEYEAMGMTLPNDLQNLEQTWLLVGQIEEAYDDEDRVELIHLLDAQGKPLGAAKSSMAAVVAWIQNDQTPLLAARENGGDWRNIYTDDNLHLRIYTRALPAGAPAAYIQLGHLLTEEDRIKHRLLSYLFMAGLLITVGSGTVSWWMTGRSLHPTRQMWEQQQTFVANASHELRTPLTLIRASAQVLQLNLDPAHPQHALLDDVIDETDYMSRLVDDMLVLSRLDAGQLQLDLAPMLLADLLPRMAQAVAPLAQEHGVRVSVVSAEGVILADRTRFWQVLLILLDNALRHTPAGGYITLESRCCDDGVKITVTDTGRGIPPADLPHIFERFYKAGNARNDRRNAGLGLAIAKPLVALHKGELNLQSTPGVQTIATIFMPAYYDPILMEIAPPKPKD